MAHSEEKKNYVIDVLYSKADGNISLCSRLTGVDRKTILKWKEEYEHEEIPDIPDTEAIKERIIRRVYKIVATCPDPKKLMDTYEAICKFEKESGHKKESVFDLISRQLESS